MFDRSATTSVFAALACLAFAPAGRAQSNSFPAGHVVINSQDDARLEEYLLDGTFVREFGADSDLGQAQAIVFGPNGVAYAACSSPGKILMYGGDGLQIGEMVDPDFAAARGLALSSRGIYAPSYTKDRVFEFAFSGDKLRTFGVNTPMVDPVGIAVGANGHIFAGSNTSDLVHEFDVDGGWLRSFGAAAAPDCAGMNIGPDGLLWVASTEDGSIMKFDSLGQKVEETLVNPNQLQYFEIGPDANLMISNSFTFAHYDSEGDTAETFSGGHTFGGAVVPYRFAAQLTGVISATGAPSVKLNLKKSIVVTYWPAQGIAALSIEVLQASDITPQLLSLSDLLLTKSMVFHGDEARLNATAKARTFNGTYVPPHSMDRGLSSMSLGLGGKLQYGYWRPTKASGAINFSRNGKVFRGTIKTKKLLNP